VCVCVCVCRGTMVWTQGFSLARQASATWALSLALFCFSCFFEYCLTLMLKTRLGTMILQLYLLWSWDYRHVPSHTPCWLRWGLSNFFPQDAFLPPEELRLQVCTTMPSPRYSRRLLLAYITITSPQKKCCESMRVHYRNRTNRYSYR
jgi:hypothetical protein